VFEAFPVTWSELNVTVGPRPCEVKTRTVITGRVALFRS